MSEPTQKRLDLFEQPITFDENYRYIQTSGAQFGLGVIAPENSTRRVIIHVINTQFRPQADGKQMDTVGERRAVVSLDISEKGLRGLHNLLERYIKQIDSEEEAEEEE